MSDYYNPVTERSVSAANFNTYIHGQLHPDRIMAEHDLVYLLSGSWEICQDGKEYTLYPDDVILLSAGKHHYGNKPCSDNTKTMYIHVNSDPLDGIDADKMIQLETLIRCQNNPRIKALFQEIIAVYWSTSGYKKEKTSNLFGLLLCELKACSETETHPCDRMAQKIVRDFQQIPQQFFSTKELAKKYNTCEKTLNKHFKDNYQKSVYRYQMDFKLEQVKRFLYEHPDAKLHEVALNFGFCDEFHLSRAFKKNTGVSPKEYRANFYFSRK